MKKAFESAQGEKRHQFISLESAPALQKAKQISFAINYKLLILAPCSDPTLERFFHLGDLKVLFSISRRINFIRKL